MKRILLVILFFVLVLLATAFTVLNAQSVTLDLYLREFAVPVSVLVFLTLIIGALLGMLASAGVILRRRQEIRRLKRRLALSEEEVLNLRNIPIKDRH